MKLEDILNIVSKVSKIPESLLKSKTRKREVVLVRNIYFLLSWNETRESLASIGYVVNRNHCTIIHGKKTIKNDMKNNWLNSYDIFKDCEKEVIKLKKSETDLMFCDTSGIEIKETNIINLLWKQI